MTSDVSTYAESTLRQTLQVRVARRFSLLIGPNDVVRYNVTYFSVFYRPKCHFMSLRQLYNRFINENNYNYIISKSNATALIVFII